jgi:5-methylcytosine-specific restriction endonuclease McrA
MPSRIKRDCQARLFERSSNQGRPRCRYCGKVVTRKAHKVDHHTVRLFTMDHVIPRSEGGMFHDDNLLSSCMQCNADRGSMPLDQFIAKLGEKATMTVEEARAAMDRARLVHDRQAMLDRGLRK